MFLLFPFIIFIFLKQIIKTSFINEDTFTTKINDSKIQSNDIFNEMNTDKYNKIKNDFLDLLLYFFDNVEYARGETIIKKKIFDAINKINLRTKLKSIEQKKNKIESNNHKDIDLIKIEQFLNNLLYNFNVKLKGDINDILYEILHILEDFVEILQELLNLYFDQIKDLIQSSKCFDLIVNKIIYDYIKKKKDLGSLVVYFSNTLLGFFINKNNYFNFNNCLQKSETIPSLASEGNPLNIHPIYFYLLVIDDLSYNKKLKYSTFFEKYFFSYGICFIESGIIMDNKVVDKIDENYFCEANDYVKIITLVLDILTDMNNITMEYFVLRDAHDNTPKKIIQLHLIPFYILIIPLFIRFLLFIFKRMIIKNKPKGIIYHVSTSSLSDDDDDKSKNNEELSGSIGGESDINNKKDNKQNIIPKWYKIITDIFSFEKNSKELFNFNVNNKSINNVLGLSYITSIIGISMILTVIGQTYFILFNSPIKNFGVWNFYETIYCLPYIMIFIGLRYSPRIIFSCSGYTLSYKYLSFIREKPKCYLITFLLLESHKYFLLILMVLFVKYSFYHIQIFASENSPGWELFKIKILYNQKTKWDILINFLTFKIQDIKIDHQRFNQDLFDYFWMPLNEVFFFIFGTILISLGHSLKLKIDYIIIVLILLLYVGKITYYKLYSEEMYTTLYYYLFEYGKLMLNPIFNLSYFLIGMYFGLINYSIQKGVNEANIFSDYYKILNIRETDKEEPQGQNITNFEYFKSKKSIERNSINFFDDNFEEEIGNELKAEKSELDDLDNDTYKKSNTSKHSRPKINLLQNDINEEDNIFDIKNIRKSTNNILKPNMHSKDSIMSNKSFSEIKDMPFLIVPTNIVNLVRRTITSWFYIFLLILFPLLIMIFILAIYYFICKYSNIEKVDNNNENEYWEKLSLHKIITNKILNIFYLIDIEIVVLSVQLGFFFLFMKGQETINGFFSHIYWSFFSKSYFSFILVLSPVILFNFYDNDSVIKLNTFTIYLYSSINLFIIFFVTILIYGYLELPCKKILKFFIRNYEIIDDQIDEEDENEDE